MSDHEEGGIISVGEKHLREEVDSEEEEEEPWSLVAVKKRKMEKEESHRLMIGNIKRLAAKHCREKLSKARRIPVTLHVSNSNRDVEVPDHDLQSFLQDCDFAKTWRVTCCPVTCCPGRFTGEKYGSSVHVCFDEATASEE